MNTHFQTLKPCGIDSARSSESIPQGLGAWRHHQPELWFIRVENIFQLLITFFKNVLGAHCQNLESTRAVQFFQGWKPGLVARTQAHERGFKVDAKQSRNRNAFGEQNEQPLVQISSKQNEKVLPQCMQSSSPDFEKAIRKPKKNATGARTQKETARFSSVDRLPLAYLMLLKKNVLEGARRREASGGSWAEQVQFA